MIFGGGTKHTAKAKKLVESAFAFTAGLALKNATILPESRKRKLSADPEDDQWVQFAIIVLTKIDKGRIMAGEKLNDRHIDAMQEIYSSFRAYLDYDHHYSRERNVSRIETANSRSRSYILDGSTGLWHQQFWLSMVQ